MKWIQEVRKCIEEDQKSIQDQMNSIVRPIHASARMKDGISLLPHRLVERRTSSAQMLNSIGE